MCFSFNVLRESLDLPFPIPYNESVTPERLTPNPKLIDVAQRDFPQASEVLVSFPSEWEFVHTVEHADQLLYLAGFPIERAHLGRSHFEGLAPEINVSLVFYRLYKFFQPWPMPQITVEWDQGQQRGQVTGFQGWRLQLQPVGQAQAWFGVNHAVLWECYLEQSRRMNNWQERLAEIWQYVERDTCARKVFTLPHEPAFEGNYIDFLKRMGFEEDAENLGWWSKSLQHDRVSMTPFTQ